MAAAGKRFRAGTTLGPDVAPLFRDGMTVFNVRQKGYSKLKEKGPSAEPLLTAVCADVLEVDKKLNHIGSLVELPPLPKSMRGPANGVPPYFIINIMLPRYQANMFGLSSQTDGPNLSVVFYFIMKPETRKHLLDIDNAPEAIRLLKRFVEDDTTDTRNRLKFMCNTLNAQNLDLNIILKKLLVEYNMKPVLTRPQHTFYTDNETYFEVDVDVNIFGYVPLRGWYSLKSLLDQVDYDFGFTIEGKKDEELPEVILGILEVEHVDLFRVMKKLDEHMQADLAQRKLEESS